MGGKRDSAVERAAAAIASARGLIIGAGAGMGVDSGLPDFRGTKGFWKAYPPMAELGLDFSDMANPHWFSRDPKLAWGFYGHRLNLYRKTQPHRGFELLKRWGEGMPEGLFVFTSNVDGQFQRSGYPSSRIHECHGSIHHLQCTSPCGDDIWEAADVEVAVDERTFRAQPPLPECPHCGALARPNILMFGDWSWHAERSDEQRRRLRRWRSAIPDRDLVVVECGAGTAVPSVRWFCERESAGSALIRINPREAHGPPGTISLASGALAALEAIDELL